MDGAWVDSSITKMVELPNSSAVDMNNQFHTNSLAQPDSRPLTAKDMPATGPLLNALRKTQVTMLPKRTA